MGKEKRKKKKKSKKHSSSDSSSTDDEELERKVKKELKRLMKKEKKKQKALKRLKKQKTEKEKPVKENSSYDVDVSLNTSAQSFVPMTKEEWEKQQNILRRVFDEETGRTRLIRGNGEIVEECVTRDRHLAINKQATKGDGEYFQKVLSSTK